MMTMTNSFSLFFSKHVWAIISLVVITFVGILIGLFVYSIIQSYEEDTQFRLNEVRTHFAISANNNLVVLHTNYGDETYQSGKFWNSVSYFQSQGFDIENTKITGSWFTSPNNQLTVVMTR